tara:strand:- start:54 stop:704 length:651 start_codon:yes stop_codon:yes gene_type:complete
MAVITSGKTFANGEQLSADKLNQVITAATFNASDAVDGSTMTLVGGAMAVRDDGIVTAKILNSNVTKAKIENVANMKVLGNTSGSAAAPEEVAILDEDNMSTDSETSLATQQSIKAYVDASSTDGFTPTAVSSGQKSVTLPNGLIMKFGTASSTSDNDQTFTFTSLGHTAFPNECLSLTTGGMASGDLTVSSTGFTINRFDSLDGTITFFWQAIGR